jgi:translation machinery-associated protein 16
MPKSLQKVQKHISKKRGVVDALHENSRDAKLLRRAGARDDRVARIVSNMARGRQSYGKCICRARAFL